MEWSSSLIIWQRLTLEGAELPVYRTIFVYPVVNRQYLSEMSYPEKNTPSLVYVRPVRMECLEFVYLTISSMVSDL
jgi:hypothetical protein